MRNRSAKRQAVEQFPAGQIIIRCGKIAKPFCAKKQALSALENRLQNAAMSRPRLLALLLALITLLAYLPVTRDSFVVYDDHDYVTENSYVQNGLTWAGIKWAFTTGHASNWHPLTWLSLMLDCPIVRHQRRRVSFCQRAHPRGQRGFALCAFAPAHPPSRRRSGAASRRVVAVRNHRRAVCVASAACRIRRVGVGAQGRVEHILRAADAFKLCEICEGKLQAQFLAGAGFLRARSDGQSRCW